MKTEIQLFLVAANGKRTNKGMFNDLTTAHKTANIGGFDEQVTYEETTGSFKNPKIVPHAHILEYRDGELYNDIYLIKPEYGE